MSQMVQTILIYLLSNQGGFIQEADAYIREAMKDPSLIIEPFVFLFEIMIFLVVAYAVGLLIRKFIVSVAAIINLTA